MRILVTLTHPRTREPQRYSIPWMVPVDPERLLERVVASLRERGISDYEVTFE